MGTSSSSMKRPPLSPCPTPNSSPPSRTPSTPPSELRPETTRPPLLPRPLPSRTSKRPLPPESSRDSMMDNHSLSRQKDEGHRWYAATNQRYGEKTRYHAIRRASPRERHQDPPKGRRCQRYGQEMSALMTHRSSRQQRICRDGRHRLLGRNSWGCILISHDLQICI